VGIRLYVVESYSGLVLDCVTVLFRLFWTSLDHVYCKLALFLDYLWNYLFYSEIADFSKSATGVRLCRSEKGHHSERSL